MLYEVITGAVISTTPGGYGAFGANHVLRQSMVFLDVPMLQQPEMYLSHIVITSYSIHYTKLYEN